MKRKIETKERLDINRKSDEDEKKNNKTIKNTVCQKEKKNKK